MYANSFSSYCVLQFDFTPGFSLDHKGVEFKVINTHEYHEEPGLGKSLTLRKCTSHTEH